MTIFHVCLLFILCSCIIWPGSHSIKINQRSSLYYKRNFGLFAIPPELVNPSYNLAAGSAVLGTVCGVLENLKGPTAKLFGGGAIAFTLFGGFVAFQTTTLRFQFDETNFSLVKADSSKIGENIVVGGENSWKYDSFVNWDFLPNEQFPILVYFKETQTPKEKWVDAPIVVDSIPGQAHFFPAIANVEELKQKFIKYNCKRATISADKTVTLQTPTKLLF